MVEGGGMREVWEKGGKEQEARKKGTEKNESGKVLGPLHPLEVTSAGGKGAYHNA